MADTGGLFGRQLEMDSKCVEILTGFYAWLKLPGGGGLTETQASPLAHEADRYLRDFLTEILERPPASSSLRTVNAYLANWYFVNTLTPSHAEIDRIASALEKLHVYLESADIVPAEAARSIRSALSEPSAYHQRLEEFWNLTPGGVENWRRLYDYRRFDHQM